MGKHLWLYAVVACVAALTVVAFAGCNSAGSSGSGGGGGSSSSASDGGVTVSLAGANTEDGKHFLVGVYAHGDDPGSADALAGGEAEIDTTGAATVTPEASGGAWTGTGGETYDVYVFVDATDDYDTVDHPNAGDYLYKQMPYSYTQDGEESLATLYGMDYYELGVVTVELDNADGAPSGSSLFGFVYPAGATDLSAANVVATEHAEIVSGAAALSPLKVDDGNWEPTSTDWNPAENTEYDLYVYTTDNPDYDYGSDSRLSEPFPLTITQEDYLIEIDYVSDMADAGTLTVSVDLGTTDHDGRDLVTGVYNHGDDPTDAGTDPVATGSATVSSGEASFVVDYPESDETWIGTFGDQYDAYVFINCDTTEDPPEPDSGDYIYSTDATADLEPYTYLLTENVEISLGAGDFVEIPQP